MHDSLWKMVVRLSKSERIRVRTSMRALQDQKLYGHIGFKFPIRYLKIIQVKRQDFNGRVLTIRRDDLQALAAIIGATVEDAPQRLAELNLLRDAISG